MKFVSHYDTYRSSTFFQILLIILCVVLLTPLELAEAANSGVLASPASQDPDPGYSYPRMVILTHNGEANGTILATFEKNVNPGEEAVFPIYRSTDNGKTWAHFSDVHDTKGYGGNRWQHMLYELPYQMGDLPAGTILCAGNAVPDNHSSTNLVLYKSNDAGLTWQYVSTIVQGGKVALHESTAVWEPFLIAIGDKLVCFISDERELNSAGYSQFLAHMYSTDGGKSWSSEVKDVGIPDRDARPGMAVVTKMGNGKYIMTYEVVSWANKEPGKKNYPTYYKISDDGLNWGNPADLGTRLQTADGLFLGSTPYNVYTTAGGDKGMVIVSARGYRDENSTKSCSDYLVNYNYGEGQWFRLPAAITHDDSTPTAGYSRSMVITRDNKSLVEMDGVKIPGYLNDRIEIRYATMPLEAQRYEAESAALLGKAVVGGEHKTSSGGKKVGMLDNAGDGANFSVKVAQDGQYNVRIRYANGWGQPAKFKVNVNGGKDFTVSLPTTLDWPIYDYVTFSTALQAGENSIKIEHDTNFAELDCIEVYENTASEVLDPVRQISVHGNEGESEIGTSGGILRMFAETAPTGAPVVWSIANLDGTPTDLAKISEEGVVSAVKNGTVKVVATAIDGNNVQGESTITISKQFKKDRFEAENGVISGKETKIAISAAASGGKKVGWLNAPGSDSVTISVDVLQDGLYIIEERYTNGLSDASHTMTINGKEKFTVKLPKTGGWDTYRSSDGIKMFLKAGKNKVRITPTTFFAELDCLQVYKADAV